MAIMASGGLAAQASAAKIAATRACYVNVNPAQGAPVTIIGSGFTPGDAIDIEGAGLFTTATASATGAFAVTASGPILSTINPSTRSFSLTATDETTGAVVASTSIEVANLAVATNPSGFHKLSEKVTFTFSGFSPGRHIYAHYRLGKKVLARATFGKATGACGVLKQKARLYPGSPARHGNYTVQFDSSLGYSQRTQPRVIATLRIGTVV